MATIMNIQGNNCTKIIIADGTFDIPKGTKVTIDENGKTYIDGMPLDEYVKNRRNETE